MLAQREALEEAYVRRRGQAKRQRRESQKADTVEIDLHTRLKVSSLDFWMAR